MHHRNMPAASKGDVFTACFRCRRNSGDNEPVEGSAPLVGPVVALTGLTHLDPAGDDRLHPEMVVMRMKTEESQYDRRTKYQSVFKDAPLYQVYQQVVRKESKRMKQSEKSDVLSLPPTMDEDLLEEYDEVYEQEEGGVTDTVNDKDSPAECRAGDDMQAGTGVEITISPVPDVGGREVGRDEDHVEAPSSEGRVARPGDSPALITRLAGTGPNRSKWAEMPEVIAKGLLGKLTPQERSRQEAQFEVITSEASYNRSLSVLINYFYKAPEMDCSGHLETAVLEPHEKHHLFSNILEIHLTSENFLHALETRWRMDPLLADLCDLVFDHAETKFAAYVTYVKNQQYQIQTLTKLLQSPRFSEAIRRLQMRPECGLLDLNSFLLLPMQRVTRLRLLVTTILHYTPPSHPAYTSALVSLAALEKVINDCDKQKSHMEHKERIMQICSKLDFKVKTVSMGNRTLVKEGELRILETGRHASTAFKPGVFPVRNRPLMSTLFLFHDVLLLARKKTNGRYSVEDSCMRAALSVISSEAPSINTSTTVTASGMNSSVTTNPAAVTSSASGSQSPSAGTGAGQQQQAQGQVGAGPAVENGHHALFRLVLLEGAKGRAEYCLQAQSSGERERWVDALCPSRNQPPGVFEDWDCPQVIVTKPYSATEGDELDLREGDLLNVLIQTSDGWYKGALPDGRRGWFPAQNAVEVANEHVKRRNMKKFLLSEEAQKAYQQRKQQRRPSQPLAKPST